MKVFIYALKDPRNDSVKYIGKTSYLKSRLAKHVYNRNQGNTHKNNWIKLLLSENLLPIMEVIEECDETNWEEKEIFWIAKYKEMGNKLTNSTDGGEGATITDENSKKKISEKLKGRKLSKETKRKISEKAIGNKRNVGRKLSQETKDKIQQSRKKSGWKHTEDGKRRLKEAFLKPILQIDKITGEIIKEYAGTILASEETGLSQSNLSNALNGRTKSAGGFIWKKKIIENEKDNI